MRLSGHLAILGVVATASALACGGKIEGASSNDGRSPATTPAPRPGPTLDPPGPPPPSPDPGSEVASRLGAQVAKRYCLMFDKCCQSTGLTPIDFASCVSYTEDRVAEHARRYLRAQAVSDAQMSACAAAIEARLASCPTSDAWWGPGEDTRTTSLFVPSSVAKACAFLDLPDRPVGKPCSAGAPCEAGETCAVDECVSASERGGACSSPRGCLDGDACVASACELASRSAGACTDDGQCPLGFVCEAKCTPAKSASNPYRERHSPYRVSLETCQIFVNL